MDYYYIYNPERILTLRCDNPCKILKLYREKGYNIVGTSRRNTYIFTIPESFKLCCVNTEDSSTISTDPKNFIMKRYNKSRVCEEDLKKVVDDLFHDRITFQEIIDFNNQV